VKLNIFSQAVVASAAVLLFSSANAADYTRPGVMAADDSFAYNSGTILADATFLDKITFTTSALSNYVTVTVENTFTGTADKIQFFLADLKFPDTSIAPLSYDFDSGSQYYADYFINAAGTYVLTVSGTASTLASGYTATIGTVAAIPEPETYALMLAGLAVVGFVGSRRRAS
jgi:PEP-CTERM motif